MRLSQAPQLLRVCIEGKLNGLNREKIIGLNEGEGLDDDPRSDIQSELSHIQTCTRAFQGLKANAFGYKQLGASVASAVGHPEKRNNTPAQELYKKFGRANCSSGLFIVQAAIVVHAYLLIYFAKLATKKEILIDCRRQEERPT